MASKWDEERFGLLYILDGSSIAAADYSNLGAIEIEGLNVLDTSLALAWPDAATDADYKRIEDFIGHECAHTGRASRRPP